VDAELLAHVRGGHHVRLDGRLQPVDAGALAETLARLGEGVLVDDRTHALVLEQVVAELRRQRLGRALADRRHARAGAQQAAQELALVLREAGLDQDDVHGGAARVRGPVGVTGP